MTYRMPRNRGFSLVELVVVIVIIAILAAMAIPRLSRGAAGANDSALMGNLSVLRNAINLYAAEHNNTFPGPTAVRVEEQLTLYSSAAGATNSSPSSTYKFGPYLVSVPPCPVGNPSDPTGILIDTSNSPPVVDTSGGEGWAYNPNTGVIIANTSDTDSTGTAYSDY